MQIIIKSISGKGFLTFKNTFNQDFEKFGNTPVLIVGENKVDAKSISNGSGKSSLIEALNFVLFGVTARALKYSDEIINWDSDACAVSVKILVGEEEYEIWRERSKGKASTLTIFHSTEYPKSVDILPQADNKTKQVWLENLLGFSFVSWSCAVMFHQDFTAFPDLKPAQRAEILSEVAGLDIYIQAAEVAKKKLILLNNRVSLLENDINSQNEGIDRLKSVNYQEKINGFELDRQQKIIVLRKEQRETKAKDEQEKKLAQKSLLIINPKIEEITKKIEDLEQKKNQPFSSPRIIEIQKLLLELKEEKEKPFISNLDGRIQELENELKGLPSIVTLLQEQIKTNTEIDGEINTLIRDISKLNNEMSKFQTLGVGQCPTCKQEVSAEHLKDHLTDMEAELLVLETKRQGKNERKKASSKLLMDIQHQYNGLKEFEKELEEKRKERQKEEIQHFERIGAKRQNLNEEKGRLEASHFTRITNQLTNFRQELHTLTLEQKTHESVINSEAGKTLVATLESQIESTRQEKNPYVELKDRNDQQIKEIEEKINQMKSEMNEKTETGIYLSYWVDGYKRLRMMMFDSLIIRLEELSQDYLSDYCSELYVTITGERDLKTGGKKDEIYIEVSGDKGKSSFEAYSGGEKQKIKMAVSLALAEVIKEKCGKDFNLIAFDEPNDSLDDIGKDTNFQVFKSIAEKKTVLVVDHDGYFKDRFDNSIIIRKEIDGSRIVAQ